MRYAGTAISIRQAFKEVKAFEWDGEYRAAARAMSSAINQGRFFRLNATSAASGIRH